MHLFGYATVRQGAIIFALAPAANSFRRLAAAAQLTGLVADNNAQLGPTLAQLDQVTAVLQRNQQNLDKGLSLLGPYYRLLDNAMGNGRWIDTYLCGLVPATPGRDCVPPGGKGN